MGLFVIVRSSLDVSMGLSRLWMLLLGVGVGVAVAECRWRLSGGGVVIRGVL